MKKTDTRIPDRAVTGMDRNLYTAWQAINSGMAGSFSVVILAVFPLVYRDYYFDILNYKTEFYYKSVLIFAAVFVLVNAVIAFLAAYLNRGAVRLGGPRLKAADWAMLAFVSAAILSTIQSDYAEAALWRRGTVFGADSHCSLWLHLLCHKQESEAEAVVSGSVSGGGNAGLHHRDFAIF